MKHHANQLIGLILLLIYWKILNGVFFCNYANIFKKKMHLLLVLKWIYVFLETI